MVHIDPRVRNVMAIAGLPTFGSWETKTERIYTNKLTGSTGLQSKLRRTLLTKIADGLPYLR